MGYEIVYCAEGYKKSADRIGYVEDGQGRACLIRRMSCGLAVKHCRRLEKGPVRAIYGRMKEAEWVARYPNPADRFVASVNFEKKRASVP